MATYLRNDLSVGDDSKMRDSLGHLALHVFVRHAGCERKVGVRGRDRLGEFKKKMQTLRCMDG